MYIISESCYEVYDRKIVILKSDEGVCQAYYKSTGSNKYSKKDQWIPFYGFAFCPMGGVWLIKHPNGKIINEEISDQIENFVQQFFFPNIEPIFWTNLSLDSRLRFLDKIIKINRLFDDYNIEDIAKNPRLNADTVLSVKKWLHDIMT